MLERIYKLVLKTVTWIASTGAVGTATLDHKIADDPMKREAVVIASLGEVDEVGTSDRRLLREELNADRPFRGAHGNGEGHSQSFLNRSWQKRGNENNYRSLIA